MCVKHCPASKPYTPMTLVDFQAQVRLQEYKRGMGRAGFNSATPLFVATGLLTYGDKSGAQWQIPPDVRLG